MSTYKVFDEKQQSMCWSHSPIERAATEDNTGQADELL
jgi:hypothetical protein